MSCERVENLIRNLFMAFTVMFLTGFLILYYAIRKLACATSNLCGSDFWPESSQIYGIDMLVMTFSIAVVFFSVLWYLSSRNSGDGRNG